MIVNIAWKVEVNIKVYSFIHAGLSPLIAGFKKKIKCNSHVLKMVIKSKVSFFMFSFRANFNGEYIKKVEKYGNTS